MHLWPAEPGWDQQVLDFLPLLGVTFGNHFIRQYLRWGGSGRAINLFLHVIVIGSLFLLSCVAPTIAALEDYRRGKRGRAPLRAARACASPCQTPEGKCSIASYLRCAHQSALPGTGVERACERVAEPVVVGAGSRQRG